MPYNREPFIAVLTEPPDNLGNFSIDPLIKATFPNIKLVPIHPGHRPPELSRILRKAVALFASGNDPVHPYFLDETEVPDYGSKNFTHCLTALYAMKMMMDEVGAPVMAVSTGFMLMKLLKSEDRASKTYRNARKITNFKHDLEFIPNLVTPKVPTFYTAGIAGAFVGVGIPPATVSEPSAQPRSATALPEQAVTAFQDAVAEHVAWRGIPQR